MSADSTVSGWTSPPPERIHEEWTPEELCQFAGRWLIDLRLATRLQVMAGHWSQPLTMISGYRTAEKQADLAAEGRPAAPAGKSTHRTCPATGADLRITFTPTDHVKAMFGQSATFAGLRWGGGSPVDDKGIPSDWNHVDLGPRT